MNRRNESSQATLLLTTRLFERAADPLSPGKFWSLVSRVEDPAKLLRQEKDALATMSPGEADRVQRLLDDRARLAIELERLESAGFLAITAFDDDYPKRLKDRLGTQAPPVLFVVGPPELLSVKSIGIVGSRHPSYEAKDVARRAAQKVVEAGRAVISGGARGIDRYCMEAAINARGRVIVILAGDLARRARAPRTWSALSKGLVCLASLYAPSVGFSLGNAMARNKVIYALAEKTLVVASDKDRGGTWSGAKEALKRNYGKVVVWRGPGERPGNAALEEKGAIPVRDLESLIGAPDEMSDKAGPGETEPSGQTTLPFGK